MSEIVDPNEYLPHLIVWSTFNIFAACSIAVLLVVTLISQRRDANRFLINLEVIFILTSATGSILVWTGHALDSHPPYALCLFNASIGMANVPLMGGSALAIVLKVWGSVMIACHLRGQRIVRWIIWKPFLLVLPYVSGLPLFIAGLIVFSIFVGAAFVVGILSLLSTFSAIIPDVVLSSCAVAVFFTFASAKPIIHFVFGCRHIENSVTRRSPSPKPYAASAPADVPQELLAFSLNGSVTTASVDQSVWQVKAVETPNGEDGREDRSSGYFREGANALG
ncbi:hypothetical protein MVEN_01057500 [Mycena venus]|uniref:Uncharacterized protein n=1 Tax=Mycena venus TaxID=2733690 RepID=A0A8H6Y5M6_9AGAR|nr:hypothetical protein MVEN_01057500 [Mycena venus]